MKQVAYARKVFNAEGVSKKAIALSVGYSENVALNAQAKIENSVGFRNAMEQLAVDSNNLVLAAMNEYKSRGFDNFSNKDLNGAMNAIASAWDRIAKHRTGGVHKDPEKNPLRKIYVQRVENQTVNISPEENKKEKAPRDVEVEIPIKEEVDLDF